MTASDQKLVDEWQSLARQFGPEIADIALLKGCNDNLPDPFAAVVGEAMALQEGE